MNKSYEWNGELIFYEKASYFTFRSSYLHLSCISSMFYKNIVMININNTFGKLSSIFFTDTGSQSLLCNKLIITVFDSFGKFFNSLHRSIVCSLVTRSAKDGDDEYVSFLFFLSILFTVF